MSDGDIAKLGIEIDTQPVKAATQDLKGLGDQAGKTADQVDKIGPALGKATAPAGDLSSKLRDGAAAATAYAGPLSAIDAAAKRAGVSAAEMATRVQGASAANTALAASSGAVETAVTRAGAGFSTFERGIAGLAVAAGGALIALAKIGDEVERSKNRLAGLTGSAESGAKAYSAVQAAAKASGVEASTLQSALEKAQIGLDTFADKHVTYANTSENAAKQTAALTAAIGTVGSIMQGNLATADEEKKALDALGTSFQNTGTLSVAAFRSIQAESPSTALATAPPFRYDKESEFVKELGKAPITIDEFVQRMAQVAPSVDAAFDPSKPKTFEQAMRGVTTAWNDVLKTVAELGGGDLLTKALGAVKDQIPIEKAALEEMARDFKALGTTIADFVGGVVTDFGKLASIA